MRIPSPALRGLTRDRARLVSSVLAAGLLIVALAPIGLTAYVQTVATQTAILAMLGLGWNVIGSARLLSFGQAAFFGAGAYTAAIILSDTGISGWLTLPIAAISGAVLAVIVIPCFRVAGLYFSIMTLALASALGIIGNSVLPGGQNGLYYRSLFGTNTREAYLAVLAGLLIVVAAVIAVRRSSVGLGIVLINADEEAARSIGVNVFATKSIAWIIAGACGGLAGGLYTASALVITPDTVFNVSYSILPVLIVTLGGLGTLYGPLLGAAIYALINNWISSGTSNGSVTLIIYGGALALLATLLPYGLVGALLGRARPQRVLSERSIDPEQVETPS
jgi:branched-chain amino acid transport system permease protein